MNKYVLEVLNIGKAYRTYKNEWHRVLSWFGIASKMIKEQWILKNINFTIKEGEAIGIVGQNGAGKSTLLKIITGTLKPTTGHFNIHGRIAAILELGMGFHPDLTGRENAYHASGLMGFSREQIDAVIEHIHTFSEIGEYFEQPVRVYSSGMQVRVAFAVATAYRPEILIIDEALSVGDTYFQHKSFERIREFQKQGTTLLIVSHDRSAIQAICDRAILLDSGSIIKDGAPEEVMDFYNALIADKENKTISQMQDTNGNIQTVSGTKEATVEEIALYNNKDEKIEIAGVGEQVYLKLKIKVHEDISSLVLGYSIKDRLGQVLYGTNTWHTNQVIYNPKSGEIYEIVISFMANFGVGSYSVQTALVDKETHLSANYEWKDLALVFSIINKDKTFFTGLLWNEPIVRIQKNEPN
ncbi:MAG: ABC transporter ATP-binding protein [Sulfurospirillaceae bacterium]|nr:ABC transporter ATP-binding protein [Sulfurospirillaceae bacterium]